MSFLSMLKTPKEVMELFEMFVSEPAIENMSVHDMKFYEITDESRMIWDGEGDVVTYIKDGYRINACVGGENYVSMDGRGWRVWY